jgi:hypothetical protein
MSRWAMDELSGSSPPDGSGSPPEGSSAMVAVHQRGGYAAPMGFSRRVFLLHG